MKNVFFFLIFAFVPVLCFPQTILYVRANSTGTQDGKSWQTAFSDLTKAIAEARYGDQIWIAVGTYKPTFNADRGISFELKNGVQWYGGFSGNETAREQRDWQNNVTTLSGEIGQPGRADNAYHVVYGKGLDSTTVLDGLSITGAYGVVAFDGTVAFENCGGGMLLLGQEGMNSRPVIRNCTIYGNACNYGGGIYIGRKDPRFPDSVAGPVNPLIEYCIFERNYAFWSGGGIFRTGDTAADDTIRIQHTIFRRNRARAGFGGGLCLNSMTNLTLLVQDCLFERDSALEGGAIIYEEGPQEAKKRHFVFKKTDFKNNYAQGEGAAFYYFSTSVPNPKVEHLAFCMEDGLLQDNKVNSGGSSPVFIAKEAVNFLNFYMNNVRLVRNKGGIYTVSILAGLSSDAQVNTLITNCVFEKNDGFALRFGSSGTINHRIDNCVFNENTAVVSAGQTEKSKGTTTFNNCTFYNNTKAFAKSFYDSYANSVEYYNNLTVNNSIFYDANVDPDYDLYVFKMFFISLDQLKSYHIYQYYFQNTVFNGPRIGVPGSGTAFEKSVSFDTDPKFNNPALGDFRLQPCSPLIGRGDNQYVREAGLSTDLDGRPRILFQNVDLGAYEQPDSCGVSGTTDLPAFRPVAFGPNPAPAAVLQWSVEPSGIAIDRIQISDATGKLVAQQHLKDHSGIRHWDTGLGSGIYFVRFFTERGAQCEKWIVQR